MMIAVVKMIVAFLAKITSYVGNVMIETADTEKNRNNFRAIYNPRPIQEQNTLSQIEDLSSF